jgi:hypothetical protein
MSKVSPSTSYRFRGALLTALSYVMTLVSSVIVVWAVNAFHNLSQLSLSPGGQVLCCLFAAAIFCFTLTVVFTTLLLIAYRFSRSPKQSSLKQTK